MNFYKIDYNAEDIPPSYIILFFVVMLPAMSLSSCIYVCIFYIFQAPIGLHFEFGCILRRVAHFTIILISTSLILFFLIVTMVM